MIYRVTPNFVSLRFIARVVLALGFTLTSALASSESGHAEPAEKSHAAPPTTHEAPTPAHTTPVATNVAAQKSPTFHPNSIITNHGIVVTPAIPTLGLGFNRSNATPAKAHEWTNTPSVPTEAMTAALEVLQRQLENARALRSSHRGVDVTPMLISLLGEPAPIEMQKAALLELAAAAQDQRELSRAQQIYAQYGQKWPNDQHIPEVLLRQGQIFREQGLHRMALAKFYAVMTSSLVLKHDQFEYYARLVIEAQCEVAETHFQLEKFADAAEFYVRLLKQDSRFINRQDAQFKLLASLVHTGKSEAAVATGTDFLSRYPNSSQQPEARFHLASALKQLGRNSDALAQVLALLREQSAKAASSPATWAYWQQRTGNLIANQLFREGDYTKALEIYLGLSQLDGSPAWQLPVTYQIGMTYERLWQPEKAIATYQGIVARESELSTNATPGLKAIIDMARWRAGFVQWQNRAENFTRTLSNSNAVETTLPAPIASVPSLDSLNQ